MSSKHEIFRTSLMTLQTLAVISGVAFAVHEFGINESERQQKRVDRTLDYIAKLKAIEFIRFEELPGDGEIEKEIDDHPVTRGSWRKLDFLLENHSKYEKQLVARDPIYYQLSSCLEAGLCSPSTATRYACDVALSDYTVASTLHLNQQGPKRKFKHLLLYPSIGSFTRNYCIPHRIEFESFQRQEQ